MKKFKGAVWTGKPNFKKIMKNHQKIKHLQIAVILSFMLGIAIGMHITITLERILQ